MGIAFKKLTVGLRCRIYVFYICTHAIILYSKTVISVRHYTGGYNEN